VRRHGANRFTLNDRAVAGGITLSRVLCERCHVVVKFGGETFADGSDFSHDWVRLQR